MGAELDQPRRELVGEFCRILGTTQPLVNSIPQVLPLSLPPTNSSLKADCIIVWPQGTEEKTTDDVHSENTDVPERFVFVHIHTQIEQNYCFMGNRRGRGARGGRRRKREEEEEEEEKEERDTDR